MRLGTFLVPALYNSNCVNGFKFAFACERIQVCFRLTFGLLFNQRDCLLFKTLASLTRITELRVKGLKIRLNFPQEHCEMKKGSFKLQQQCPKKPQSVAGFKDTISGASYLISVVAPFRFA